jgi:ribosomal protein S18 acetylase RimI-like enzyme
MIHIFKVRQLPEEMKELVYNFAEDEISDDYLERLLQDSRNHIALYTIDGNLSKNSIASLIVFRVQNRTRLYLLLLCTFPDARDAGYGKLFLTEFIERMRKKEVSLFLLNPLSHLISFYEGMNFTKSIVHPYKHRIFFHYEKYNKDKEYHILELSLTKN